MDIFEKGGLVVAVSRNVEHAPSKSPVDSIHLIEGRGVDGDAHEGETVQHRSRVAQDPTQPNLRQVHLIHAELFEELKSAGFSIAPGQLGENITTQEIDLLSLPTGTELRIGSESVVEVTGLRNPCGQLNEMQDGLLDQLVGRDAEGNLIRKAGIMAIVLKGGAVHPGDAIEVDLPDPPHVPLDRV